MRRPPLVARLAVAVLCCTVAARARAVEPGADDPSPPADQPTSAERLDEVVVEDERQPLSAASSDEINSEIYRLRPHDTLQEVLNNVPGLIVRQHQGGGKATQYLIRGFNADHGTDFFLSVDGLPVNLPTNAHGQGYADLNFVIPETIETLQLRKGPYFAPLGDFATAGALNLVLREKFDEDFALGEWGSWGRQRYVVGLSPKIGPVQTLLSAQAYYSDGPFIHPENFARYNGYARFTVNPTPTSTAWLSGTIYQADWDASGQIPWRLVTAGRLDRFGSLDPTEGGRTDRENIDLHWLSKPTPDDDVKIQLWASRYKLRLWSDFTFWQNALYPDPRCQDGSDPDCPYPDDVVIQRHPTLPRGTVALFDPRGDGIEQNDQRWFWGADARWQHAWQLRGVPTASSLGFQTRSDYIDVAVWQQVKRNRFFADTRAHVAESSYSGWASQEMFFTEWLRGELGLRGDFFTFDVQSYLPQQPEHPAVPGSEFPNTNWTATNVNGFTTAGIVSPKLDVVVTPLERTDIYLNAGSGFHSNDARGVVLGVTDPRAIGAVPPLARAVGGEVGSRTTQLDGRFTASTALWIIDLQSELLFCGDCGAFDSFTPTPATRRWGVDVETRYRMLDWLTADYDLSWADPRYVGSGDGVKPGDAIPIAPTLFMNGGLTAEFANGFSTAFRVRYLDHRPAVEDRSLWAPGYLIFDLFAKYRWRNVELSLDLLNLTNAAWDEAVFADTSCTKHEARIGRCPNTPTPARATDPVIHFTPGDPFAVRGGLTVYFP